MRTQAAKYATYSHWADGRHRRRSTDGEERELYDYTHEQRPPGAAQRRRRAARSRTSCARSCTRPFTEELRAPLPRRLNGGARPRLRRLLLDRPRRRRQRRPPRGANAASKARSANRPPEQGGPRPREAPRLSPSGGRSADARRRRRRAPAPAAQLRRRRRRRSANGGLEAAARRLRRPRVSAAARRPPARASRRPRSRRSSSRRRPRPRRERAHARRAPAACAGCAAPRQPVGAIGLVAGRQVRVEQHLAGRRVFGQPRRPRPSRPPSCRPRASACCPGCRRRAACRVCSSRARASRSSCCVSSAHLDRPRLRVHRRRGAVVEERDRRRPAARGRRAARRSRVPGPIAKLLRLPPSRQRTCPLRGVDVVGRPRVARVDEQVAVALHVDRVDVEVVERLRAVPGARRGVGARRARRGRGCATRTARARSSGRSPASACRRPRRVARPADARRGRSRSPS